MYGVAELAQIAMTKMFAHQVNRKHGVTINGGSPGCAHCLAARLHARQPPDPSARSDTKTDMSSHQGTNTPAEGADTPVWLATMPPSADAPNGGLFGERREVEW